MFNPLVLLGICTFLVMLVPVLLFLFTYIFRQACAWSGLKKPSVATAAGVMLLIRLSTTFCEALMEVLVHGTCDVAGLPGWESGLIVFFLLLPIDLLISAGLHSGLMNIRFGKGIEVWFVQWLIILSIVAAITFVVGIVILIYKLNG
jgi:hypothetical protein